MLKKITSLHASLYFFPFLICLINCKPSELANPCDPNSQAFTQSEFIKFLLNDRSSNCSFSTRSLGSASQTFNISGANTGLLSSGLVLQNNNTDDQRLNYGAANFNFPTKVSDYSVTVKSQPKLHNCTVSNGTGKANTDITSVSVSCVPKQAGYLIVSNVTSTNISVYSINASTGALTQVAGSPFTNALCSPRGLAISPDSNFLFAACQGENKIRVYNINKTNGALADISGSPFNIPSGSPTKLSLDPTGKWLALGTDNPSTTIHMYSVNSDSGTPSLVGSYSTSGTAPYGVTIDSLGKFVYAGITSNGNVDAWQLNTNSGALTSTGAPVAGGANAIDITTDPSGRFLYAANYSGPGRVFVYTINSSSGVLTQISGLGPGYSTVNDSPDSILVDPKNRFVYVGNQTPATLAGFTIDSSTGALTAMAGSPFAGYSGALAMDPSGTYLYSGTGGSVRAFSINATTGIPALIGTVAAGTDQTGLVIASY